MRKVRSYILGAGGFAREVALVAMANGISLSGFIDISRKESLLDIPVITASDLKEKVVAIYNGLGTPQHIKKAVLSFEKEFSGKIIYPSLVHPSAVLSEWVSLGRGVVVCAGGILTCDIEIGDFSFLNLACTVGHDTKIGKFCAISPGANISGRVEISDFVYIGTGASINENLKIGANSVIGAGAVVVDDVEPNVIVAGVPAKVIRRLKV